MSTILDNKQRPFSADIARITKVRLQSSNCPTILKHEVNNPMDTFVNANMSEKQLILDRPRTASNATKMKFSFLQSIRPMGSPLSGASVRPMSGAVNSSINFEFLNNIGKTPRGKFQDRSKIKPLKKLNIDQFHSVIYKVKQQKEILEKEINRMEQWHKDFKENDIWNTPQSAIIESIMRQNAKSNPDGSVSKYLQTEKEKEEGMRSAKKLSQRPVSSYASLGVRSPVSIKSAKSVKDFFGPEDNGVEVIEEIITTKNPYYNQYSANKKKITDKVNRYVDNLENYNTLMHSTKELSRNQEVAGLREHKEGNHDVSEIVESREDSESSPSHAHRHAHKSGYERPHTSHQGSSPSKNRPFSAKMVVNTAFAPKDFANGLTGQIVSPHGMPASIHTRPHTAKQVRVPVLGTISSGLAATGEPRQESVGSVKFLPIMMEGHKIPVEPYNQTVNKSKEGVMSSKGFSTQGESGFKGSKSSKTIQTSPSSYILRSPTDLKEQEGNRQRRVLSGKASVKSSAGTQTLTTQNGEMSAPIGKLNIDGEYFHSFKGDNGTRSVKTAMAGERKKINIIDSWTTKETRTGQEKEML